LIYIEKTYFKFDASNGLSSDKLIHNMDRKHPRLIEKDPISNLYTLRFFSWKTRV